MVSIRASVRSTAFIFVFVVIPLAAWGAQVSEPNINMVSGTEHPGGDPFLRQQNEPSIAVSTRNPLHLLAGANDYRSVDIPFLAPARPDEEETGDAWIGVFKSRNGGNTWSSTLLDGYPQQANSTSPLKGYQAAADPVVRAGNGGMFYLAGIVLNRGENPLGAFFVARFIDNNNSEVSDSVAYLDTKMLEKGTAGQFIDKPWLAVDPKPNGGQCTVNGQTFPAQNIYVAYSIFVGNDNNIRTKMMFNRSTDCGATWGTPTKLSESFPINQGASIAIDPSSNAVYVAWRQFKTSNITDAILLAKSIDQGKTFGKATVVTNITPFDQGTSKASLRTNSYPTATVTGGRLYIAWSQRNAPGGDARIVLISSSDGVSFTDPVQVDPADHGHQFMPSMTSNGGKLTIVWYDLRQDHTVGTYSKSAVFPGFYDEHRTKVGNLALDQITVVFWNFMADLSPDPAVKLLRRHTLEVFAADSNGGVMPTFTTTRVSRYKFGSGEGSTLIQDLQINPPNLPMFRQGTVPFLGDYIDVASYVNGQAGETSSSFSASGVSTPSRIRHVVWTDNRDVRPPLGNPSDWTKYTPVKSPALSPVSKFDPTRQTIPCADPGIDASGSRNQNIYTARVTDGMFAGSPGNAKPLGTIQRAFAVFVHNARNTTAAYRLAIAQQPPAPGLASFLQFSSLPQLDVTIPPRSTATRSVFVTGARGTKVDVNVTEITSAGGTEVPGGLSSVIGINTDPANPDIGNPDIGNPDIGNAEVFNPDIGNPDIGNPDIGNPDIGNPDIGNPDIGNPDIGNPDIGNPDIGNPDIGNPDIGNPDIGNPDIGNQDIVNGSFTDTTWTATNEGNTTGGFTVKLLKNGDVPSGFKTQLILNKIYSTPVARDCNLGLEHHRQVIANINNPEFASLGDLGDPSLTNPSVKNATMWLAPRETGRITLRVVDPIREDGINFDAAASITPVVIAQAVNTADANGENQTPSISLTILTASLPAGTLGTSYNAPLSAIGGRDPKTWTAAGLPAGLTVSGAAITGTAQVAGTFSVTITVTDSSSPTHVKSKTLTLLILSERTFVVTNTNDSAAGSLRQAILEANANTGFTDKIVFTIPGPAPHVITPSSPLPAITDPVVIDATPSGACDGSAPTVEIDGVSAGVANGLLVSSGGTTIRGLAITRFASSDAGIFISGGAGSVVQCSYVGLAADGVSVKGNSNGIRISGSSNNTIGGTGAARNVISGNNGEGVRIDGATATGNGVQGNYIGTSASGAADVGNINSGVYIRRASGNSVVGNVISGNNGFAGVAICGNPTFCGGGDDMGGSASANVVKANLIGTTAAGTAALGNAGFGVSIDGATDTVVGGSAAGEENVIAANGSNGIHIFGPSPDGNLIRGNSIGTDAGGTLNLGNSGVGVLLATGSNNTIGGTSVGTAQNIIAFNGGAGISLQAGAGRGNLLRFNQIHSNLNLGIDLNADGVTPNDADDVDMGPNDLQNFPQIQSVRTGGGTTRIDGTLQSTANTEFVIDFFHSPTCDGTGFGEGRTWFGSVTQTTDDSGNLSISTTIEIGLSSGVVTALATSPNINTSEFSACATVQADAGGALSFDGVDDLVSVSDASSLNLQTLTVEAWVKIDDPNFAQAPLLSKGSDYGNYTLGIGGDQGAGLSPRNVLYVHQTATGNFSCCSVSPGPVSFGVWTHVAATFSAGVARVYVNGAFVATTSDGPPPVENNAALTLGRAAFRSVPSQFLKGVIDEVRIWNIARSDAQIAQNHNKAISPATPGLVAYWKFDESSGQAVTDSTASGNHGTRGVDATVAPDDPGRIVSTAPILP